jgi:hypothetical protein
MTPEGAKALHKVLSSIEIEFLYEIHNHVDGDVSEFIMYPALYAIGKKLGLSKDEICRYSISLGNRGLLDAESVLGREIAAVRLTTDGADFVILTR